MHLSQTFQSLVAAALLTAAATAQCSTLSYAGSYNAQKGTMFEIQNLSATQPMVIGSFDQAFSNAGAADIEIYTINGSCAGVELVSTAWTLLGTAAGVVHTGGTTNPAPLTPIPIPINVTIAPGATQSFYITATNATGSSVYYTSGVNQYGVAYTSNADLALVGRTGMSYPFASGFGLPTAGRLWNGVVHYCPAGGGTLFSTVTPVGTGCVDRASATFYETFPQTTFDLSNTSLMLVPSTNGYVAMPGSTNWWTPVGSNLGLTDDSVSAALALGFTLPYPGGTTTDVYASSNGFVWAQNSTVNGCCAGDPTLFVQGAARWSLLWNDLNPGAGGTVVFDQDLVGGAAYLTYTGIQEYGQAANLNTFQIAFFSTGVVEYRWQTCAITAHQALVGWTPGLTRDPGTIDISAATTIVTQPDANALALAASARPIGGTAISLNTSNLTPTAPFGAIVLGLSNPNLPLGPLGMAGCNQYSDAMATVLYLPLGAGSVATPFGVPNLVGLTVFAQSFAYDPAAGLTALGATSSNGVALLIGDY